MLTIRKQGKKRVRPLRASGRFFPTLRTLRKDPKWVITQALMRAIAPFVLPRMAAATLARMGTRWRVPPRFLAEDRPSLFPDLEVSEAVSALKHDGVYLGINLPAEVLSDILEYCSTAVLYGNQDPAMGFRHSQQAAAEEKNGRPFSIACFFNTVKDCPAIRALTEDSGLLAIAAAYLGCVPRFHGIHLRKSYVVSTSDWERSEKLAQWFHSDYNDYNFVKFFFYLTDVDRLSGPTTFVLGTHRRKKLRHQFDQLNRFEDGELEADYGKGRVMAVQGPAGFGFAVDTYGFHKGDPPRRRGRILLELEYGMFYFHRDRRDLRDASLLRTVVEPPPVSVASR